MAASHTRSTGSAFITPKKKHSRRLDACWASTNPASRGISTACGAICAKPSKTFFARALARRTVPWFNPALAMRRSLSASNIARAKRPSIWINCCRWAWRSCRRQQFIQIDGRFARAIFEAESDLRIAKAGLNHGTVRRANALAKNVFDGLAQIAPHAVEMPRDAGFVLAQQASNLRECFFFGVIKAEPVLLVWLEAIECGLQSAGEPGY